MREGVTNKGGGGYRAARRGHLQGRGVIALKKETDKHINKHLNAQERGHREGWGFERNETSNKRASAKRPKQKRATVKATERKTNERKASKTERNERANEKGASETETKRRESVRMKTRANADRAKRKRTGVEARERETNLPRGQS